MIVCRNCEAQNEDSAEHCKDCQANLKLRKYSREDDPVTQNAALVAENAKLAADLEAERNKHVTPPTPDPAPVTKSKRVPFFG